MKYKCSPIVQNIPFRTIKSPIKTEDLNSFCTPSHLKAYQPNINFLILKNISPCKPLVKIFVFWFSDSIFQNHKFLSNVLPESIILDRNVILCRSNTWTFWQNHGSVIVLIYCGAWHKIPLLTINSKVVNYLLDKTFQGW